MPKVRVRYNHAVHRARQTHTMYGLRNLHDGIEEMVSQAFEGRHNPSNIVVIGSDDRDNLDSNTEAVTIVIETDFIDENVRTHADIRNRLANLLAEVIEAEDLGSLIDAVEIELNLSGRVSGSVYWVGGQVADHPVKPWVHDEITVRHAQLAGTQWLPPDPPSN